MYCFLYYINLAFDFLYKREKKKNYRALRRKIFSLRDIVNPNFIKLSLLHMVL